MNTLMSNHRRIPLAKPYIENKDIQTVISVLKSGMLSLGPKYLEFEKAVRDYTGSKYACAVANGTAGLHLAVKSLGLKEGDEVITSPFSFISSSNSLLYERVKPVFVDIEKTTFNLDPDKIKTAITKKTKAILVVHMFGQPANMDEILKIAKDYNLRVIEDACESIGSFYKRKMAGTLGDIGVYAFYPNKQMTTGEGGMIVTDKKNLHELCCSMRNQGRNKKVDWLVHERLGYNYRMDEMSAALGTSQIKKLDWMIEQKKKIAILYNQKLSSIPSLVLPSVGKKRIHSWFVYVIRVTNGKRDELMNQLAKKNIHTRPYVPVIHLQPFMKKMFGFQKGDFPIAEEIASQTLALPFYIGLRKNDIQYVADKIKSVLL